MNAREFLGELESFIDTWRHDGDEIGFMERFETLETAGFTVQVNEKYFNVEVAIS